MGVRVVKTMADVQKALNELFDWKSQQQSSNIDLHGRRIINAGRSQAPTDYVTKQELITTAAGVVGQPPVFYTITFNPPDGAPSGSISPPFRIGTGRSGNPTQCWIQVNGAPTSVLTCNFQYNGVNLLAADLSLGIGLFSAMSATFTLPVQLMAQDNPVTMILTSANTATGITGGVVIQTMQLQNATQPVKR